MNKLTAFELLDLRLPDRRDPAVSIPPQPRLCARRTSAGFDLGHTYRPMTCRNGELWETLAYLVLWVCGLIVIGLC